MVLRIKQSYVAELQETTLSMYLRSLDTNFETSLSYQRLWVIPNIHNHRKSLTTLLGNVA